MSMSKAAARDEAASLVARCPRSVLEDFVTAKIIADAHSRDELGRLLSAKIEADATMRPAAWSSRALLNWLPSVLVAEICKHLDAKSLAKAAVICRAIYESVDEAIAGRTAALGLRLPVPIISGQSATQRLWFTESVGRTGLAWEIIEQSEKSDDDPPASYAIVLRHLQSGLLLFAARDSNGWVEMTVPGCSSVVALNDCNEDTMDKIGIGR